MASGFSVEVRGIPELIDGTEKLTGRIGESAAEGLGRVADQAGGDVRGLVPHRTGKLAASVKSRLAKSQKRSRVAIGARVPYAGWIEFGGTRGRPYVKAGRYLFPTALDAEPRAVTTCEKAADQEIRGFRWKTP